MNPSDQAEDAALARQTRDGSSVAFGILVGRYHGRVFAFLLALTRHRQDAEDLTQETFLRAWEKFHRYDPQLPLLPWLLTIARRQSIAALRRKRPAPAALPPPAEAAPAEEMPALWLLASSRLGADAYSALWLHYHDELPLKQVASILGKREGTVKVLLHRARKTLAGSLRGAAATSDFSYLSGTS